MPRQSLSEIPAANAFNVAPDRYLFSGGMDRPEGFKAVRNAAPYQTGDVIYVAYGAGFTRAYVYRVWAEHDAFGDYRERYYVRRETSTGAFAKNFYRVHPSQVQEGYRRAGLAPDVPA